MQREQIGDRPINAVSEGTARQAVADAGRMLLDERLVARTWGNVSCRTGAQSYVITPSGLCYENVSADDVVPYNMGNDTWRGFREPSSEKGVHSAVYRRFPDAGAVIHTHQTYASALGLAGFETLVLTEREKNELGGIALARYGLPGSSRITESVSQALGQGAHIVLMAQHGALIAGGDMDEAFRRARLLENICRSACKGQPAQVEEDVSGLAELAERVKGGVCHVAYTTAPAVRKTAATVTAFRAQLDDMAQMIGPELVTVETDPATVLKALEKWDAVLVSGVGAICRADTAGDCDALKLLVEKACTVFLHTRALGCSTVLSYQDAQMMRRGYIENYRMKY